MACCLGSNPEMTMFKPWLAWSCIAGLPLKCGIMGHDGLHLTEAKKKATDAIGIFPSLAGDIVKADASVPIFGLWCPVQIIPDSLPCWVLCHLE